MMRNAVSASAARVAVAAAMLSGCGFTAPQSEALEAVRVEAGQPLEDPSARFWRHLPEKRVELLAQTVVAPKQPQPATSVLSVRAAHDGNLLAVRIEWEDATEDVITSVDRFGDQVALELPLQHGVDPQPSPMMGHVNAPVRIMQWRAVLQHELAHGAPAISDLYPNAVVDLYPDRLLSGEVAASYRGGRSLGNPVSRPRLLSPVVTQIAEGYGTLTDAPDQPAGGGGEWRDGRWRVVITMPFAPASRGAEALRPAMQTVTAFAVWDGGKHEVGSRKAWSSWVPLRIEP